MSHRDNEPASRPDPGTVQPLYKPLELPERPGVGRRSISGSSRQSYPSSPHSSRDPCMSSPKSTSDVPGSDWTSSGVSSPQVHNHKWTVSQRRPSGEFHLPGSPSSSRTSFDMKRLMSKPLSLTSSIPANVSPRLASFPTTSTTAPNMGTKKSTTDPFRLSTSTHSFPYRKFGYLDDIYAPTSYTPRAPLSYRVAAGLTDEVGSMGPQSNNASHAHSLPRNHKISGGSSLKRPSLSINKPTIIDSTIPRFPITADELSSNLDTFRFPPQSHDTASSVTIDHSSGSKTQPSVAHPSPLGERSLTPASQLAFDWRESKHLSEHRESDVDEKEQPPISSNPQGMPAESRAGGKTVAVGEGCSYDVSGTPSLSAPDCEADGGGSPLHKLRPKVSRKLSKRRPQLGKNDVGGGTRETHPVLDLDSHPTTPVDSPTKAHTGAPRRKSSTTEDGWRSYANLLKASPQVAGRPSKTLGDAVVTVPSPRREGTLSRLMRKLSTSSMREAAGLGPSLGDVPPVPPLPTSAHSSPARVHMRQRSSSADFSALLRKKEPSSPKEQGSVSRIFKRRTTSVSPKSAASDHRKTGADATSLNASTNVSGSLPTDHSATSLRLSSSRTSTSDEMLITPIEPVPPLPRACTIYTSGTSYPSRASSISHGVHTTYHDPHVLHQFSLNNSSPQLVPSPSGFSPYKPRSSAAADSSMISILSEANRDVELPRRFNSLRKRVGSLRKRAVSGDTAKATQDAPQSSSFPSPTLSRRKSRGQLMRPRTTGDNESASRSLFNWRRSTSRSRASSIDSPVQHSFNASLTNVAFLEIDPTTGNVPGGRRRRRTDDEKDAMWDELMKRSNSAPGGTLQAAVGVKLESDDME